MSVWEVKGATDEWYTPPHVFEALGERFDLDVAHPENGKTHVPCDRFYSELSLMKTWTGFVWMNPPFGGRDAVTPWIDRFFDHGNGLALTPDRTSAGWFHRAWRRADLVMFTPRLCFLRPDGSIGPKPSCGAAIWASGNRGCDALRRAARAGLGVIAMPERIAA